MRWMRRVKRVCWRVREARDRIGRDWTGFEEELGWKVVYFRERKCLTYL